MVNVLDRRRCGVLLHPSSLPGPFPTGTLGTDAFRFVDFLVEAGFSVWQMLPTGPVDAFGSPYCLSSVYAGDARLIDTRSLAVLPQLPGTMDFPAVRENPSEAYRSFHRSASEVQKQSFATFTGRHRRWVFAWALFVMCCSRFDNRGWWEWPEEYRNRTWETLLAMVAERRDEFQGIVFQQFVFELQWMALKQYANERGVWLFGDIPFYVDRHSVDVWWSRRFFRLDESGSPEAVAGVPPDYFNEDGQLWGNPLYDWSQIEAEGFDWWRARLMGQLRHFDLLRIDHFRALESYWEVPAGAETARDGCWRPGFGDGLLCALQSSYSELPLVAEDLGIVTDRVNEMRDRYNLPGMHVLQFGFDGQKDNPHLPDNHRENSVSYTGTHDNDTLLGWYDSLDQGTREYVCHALGTDAEHMPEFVIDAAFASRSRLAMVPMQDLLGLGSEARMNMPGTAVDNWQWRMSWDDFSAGLAQRCRDRAGRFDRLVS